MASTYSPKLRFELIGAGEQAGLWGTTTNKNVGQLIEQAIAGVTTVELDGLSGNYTLTALDGAPDQSRSAVVKCTYAAVPASGTVNIIIPTQTKLYVFRNDCGQTITVKTAAQVTGVTLLNGEATLVFCDGTNALAGIATAGVGPTTVANGGTGATSFTAGFIKSPGGTGTLTSSSSVSLTADVSGTLPVASGGTGVTSVTSGRIVLGNGSGPLTVLSGNNNGDLATWSSALSAWVALPAAGAGVTSFSAGSTGFSPSITSTGAITLSGTLNVANGGTGSTTQSGARSNLGLGSMATQDASSVNITGGTIGSGVTLSGLSGYATLSGSNTFSGSTNTFNGGEVRINSSGQLISKASSSPNSSWGSFFQSPSGNPAIAIYGTGSGSVPIAATIDASGTTNWALWYTGSPSSFTIRGGVEWNGSVIVYSGTSDYRLKENVVPLNNAITKLKALKPVQFNWKEFPTTGNHDGFIAHEFQEVIPDGVTGKKDDLDKDGKVKPQGLDASFAIPVLTKALQEAIARIETLEAEVAALKGA